MYDFCLARVTDTIRIVNVKRSRQKGLSLIVNVKRIPLSLLDSQLTDTSSPFTFHCSDKIDFFYSPLLHSTLGLAGCWAASAAASHSKRFGSTPKPS